MFPIDQEVICGDPDFILCCHARFVALELKKEGENPRKLQEYKGKEIKRVGGIYLVADRSNWGEIKVKLRLLDRGMFI